MAGEGSGLVLLWEQTSWDPGWFVLKAGVSTSHAI